MYVCIYLYVYNYFYRGIITISHALAQCLNAVTIVTGLSGLIDVYLTGIVQQSTSHDQSFFSTLSQSLVKTFVP